MTAALVFGLAFLGGITGLVLASLNDAFRRDERDNRSIQSSESDQ